MKIDWLKASVSQRKTLYRHLKDVADRKNIAVEKLCFGILGTQLSEHYVKTLRAGTYSCKNALQFYQWLERNEADAARRIDQEMVSDQGDVPGQRWQSFLDAHGQSDGCAIMLRGNKGFEIVGITRLRPTPRIKLNQDFYLQVECPINGVAGAVQSYAGSWYPLPLFEYSMTLRVSQDQIAMPLHPETGTVDYLSEPEHTGPREFVVMASESEEALSVLSATAIGARLGSAALDTLAQDLEDQPHAIHVWRLPCFVEPG